MRKTSLAGWIGVAGLVVGCTGSPAEEPTEGADVSPPTEEHGAPLPVVPEGAKVFFVTPAGGDQVSSPVHVEMGVDGMALRPAGTMEEASGHHHLILDGEAVPAGQLVPADATHIHFGNAQTETDVVLTPGRHTLRLQFADAMHRSYGPEMSTAIEVEVVEGETKGGED